MPPARGHTFAIHSVSRVEVGKEIVLKWFIWKQLAGFATKWGYDTGYAREIVDEAGVAMSLTAGAAAGPSLQLGVKMAEGGQYA